MMSEGSQILRTKVFDWLEVSSVGEIVRGNTNNRDWQFQELQVKGSPKTIMVWGDQCGSFEVGDVVKVVNGVETLFRGRVRISAGMYGWLALSCRKKDAQAKL